jgi:hypothetical protein
MKFQVLAIQADGAGYTFTACMTDLQHILHTEEPVFILFRGRCCDIPKLFVDILASQGICLAGVVTGPPGYRVESTEA